MTSSKTICTIAVSGLLLTGMTSCSGLAQHSYQPYQPPGGYSRPSQPQPQPRPSYASQQPSQPSQPRLLYRGTAEYGWSHNGVSSWGANWGKRAQNEALEQIRTRIASMVNLQQLETFTNSNFSTSIKASGAGTYGYGQGSIAYAGSKNTAEQVRWVNGNNFLINVKAVRIKPGTDWSKGSQNWKGERTWKAAATMIYEYEVYGR